ncbi:MAG: response regulator, partial [Nitrospirae bacterium]|nr:response regulator [Nitrospirota bacterium]
MKERLLIVDNEPEMLELMSILIRENTPYEPLATNNPMEALEIVRKGSISLVIAEMKLPVMDGIQLLEKIREIDSNIPVIITAAYGTVEHGLETMNKGGFDYITKPFRKEQMLFSIEKALNMTKLKSENIQLREWFKTADRKNLPVDILL